jgi:hypothetical protein
LFLRRSCYFLARSASAYAPVDELDAAVNIFVSLSGRFVVSSRSLAFVTTLADGELSLEELRAWIAT